jgi:hypothetical protein
VFVEQRSVSQGDRCIIGKEAGKTGGVGVLVNHLELDPNANKGPLKGFK